MIKPRLDSGLEPRVARSIRNVFWGVEGTLYLVVGLLLITAAVLVVVGTISGLITAINKRQDAVDTGVVVLDRVLLTLIVAELVHTLRLVVVRDEIVPEPFLFVGLIAVVRRILIITAELERQTPGGRALTNLLLELGLLGFLALSLAVAIYLVRRSRSEPSHEPEPSGTRPPDTLPT